MFFFSPPALIINDFLHDRGSFHLAPFALSSPRMCLPIKGHFIPSLLLTSATLFLLSGSDIKVPVAILNCLYARQLCFEDPSCSAILEIIPRVCGPELGEYRGNIHLNSFQRILKETKVQTVLQVANKSNWTFRWVRLFQLEWDFA